MSIVISATCNTPRHPAALAVVAARPAAGLTKGPGIRAYPLPATCRTASLHGDPAAGWPLREDGGEYDIPDLLKDADYATDAELYTAAEEHARHLRRAQGNLEDALNLARVLAESVSGIGDSRAVQAEAVMSVVDRKLNKALNRLDRHDSRHRNLFFAYFDLKARSAKDAD